MVKNKRYICPILIALLWAASLIFVAIMFLNTSNKRVTELEDRHFDELQEAANDYCATIAMLDKKVSALETTVLEYKYQVSYIEDYENFVSDSYGNLFHNDATIEDAIVYLAKLVWGEDRSGNKQRQAAVIWTVFNRVDHEHPWYPNDIIEVITQENQYTGYNRFNPVEPEIVQLCWDVYYRWQLEHVAVGEVGRVLPAEIVSFRGDGQLNHFYYNDWTEYNFNSNNPYKE